VQQRELAIGHRVLAVMRRALRSGGEEGGGVPLHAGPMFPDAACEGEAAREQQQCNARMNHRGSFNVRTRGLVTIP
jgi:hypothetical protein